MNADDEQAIIPIRGEVVLRPGDAWPDAVRDELYQCYKMTRSAARARRWYQRQVGEDAQIPSARTVQEWARFYDWPALAEAEYRLEYGTLLYETERQSLANYIVALQVEGDILTGAFDDNPLAGALRQKASDTAQRRHERKIQTMAPKPPEEKTQVVDVPREEGEAKARKTMIQRKKDGSHG